MLVFQHKLGRGLFEGPSGPDAVDLGLSRFFHHSCEVPFGFLELSCASALANSPPEDALVDMPIPARMMRPGTFLRPMTSSFPSGTPVAGLIVVDPGIEFKPIEANTLRADGDLGEEGLTSALKRLRSMPR